MRLSHNSLSLSLLSECRDRGIDEYKFRRLAKSAHSLLRLFHFANISSLSLPHDLNQLIEVFLKHTDNLARVIETLTLVERSVTVTLSKKPDAKYVKRQARECERMVATLCPCLMEKETEKRERERVREKQKEEEIIDLASSPSLSLSPPDSAACAHSPPLIISHAVEFLNRFPYINCICHNNTRILRENDAFYLECMTCRVVLHSDCTRVSFNDKPKFDSGVLQYQCADCLAKVPSNSSFVAKKVYIESESEKRLKRKKEKEDERKKEMEKERERERKRVKESVPTPHMAQSLSHPTPWGWPASSLPYSGYPPSSSSSTPLHLPPPQLPPYYQMPYMYMMPGGMPPPMFQPPSQPPYGYSSMYAPYGYAPPSHGMSSNNPNPNPNANGDRGGNSGVDREREKAKRKREE